MTEPTLREQYGQALRRWGLLDEVNDPAATEEFAVTDLLSVRDEEMERMKHLVAASSEDGHTVRRVADLEAEVARLKQAVTDADQDAAEAREHNEQTCEAVTERDRLRATIDRVRTLTDRYQIWHEGGWAPSSAADVAREYRAALDQPQEPTL